MTGDHVARGAGTCLGLMLLASAASTQTLKLPPRPPGAPSGSAVVSVLTPLSREEREEEIFRQITTGNVPAFLRRLVPVTDTAKVGTTDRRVTYFVTPDYLAVGGDDDYVLMPMTPLLAQRLADALGCSLPTRKMVDAIYRAAAVKLSPEFIPPSPAMTTVPAFARHHEMMQVQRAAALRQFPLGALVAGHKKDVIISNDIYARLRAATPKPVVIYGWHMLDGAAIQPAYNGHGETYADYSHGIRLVQQRLSVDGEPSTFADVLADAVLCVLLSDEGVIARPRYDAGAVRRSPSPVSTDKMSGGRRPRGHDGV